MVKIFILLFLAISSQAEIRFTPGASVSYLSKTDTKLGNDSIIKKSTGVSLNGSFEADLFLNLSFTTNLSYETYSTKTRYTYSDGGTTYVSRDNQTALTSLNGSAGLNFYLVNFSFLRIYAGAGYTAGSMSLAHSREDYEEANDSTTGYVSTSKTTFNGEYVEAGLSFLWDKNNGLTLRAKRTKMNNGGFKTLSNVESKTTATNFSVNYIHVVNFSFFWK